MEKPGWTLTSTIAITHATIVRERGGMDKVSLTTTFPSPYACDYGPLTLHFDVQRGKGLSYLQEHFNLEADFVEVIEVPSPLDVKLQVAEETWACDDERSEWSDKE